MKSSLDQDIANICGGDEYECRPDFTPISHPRHHTVGRDFMAHGHVLNGHKSTRWFCLCHDQGGYWMFSTDGHGVFTNVSERAIGRTFHEIYRDDRDGKIYEWSQWGKAPGYVGVAV